MSQFVNSRIEVPVVDQRAAFPTYVLVSAILLMIGGAAHGLMTGRWKESAGSEKWTEALDRVPDQVGEWVGTDLSPLDHPRGLKSVYREYRNQITNRSVNMLLIGGPPAILERNPIDRLFAGRAYRAVSDPHPVTIRARHDGFRERISHALLEVDFYEPGKLDTKQLIAVWGWTVTGIWESPQKPVDRFADTENAWRLYVSQTWDFAADDRPDDIVDFLQTAIPELSVTIGAMPVGDQESKP